MKAKQYSRRAIDSVLDPATADGVAMVVIAVDLASGELDVASNVTTGVDAMLLILREAGDVIRTGVESRITPDAMANAEAPRCARCDPSR